MNICTDVMPKSNDKWVKVRYPQALSTSSKGAQGNCYKYQCKQELNSFLQEKLALSDSLYKSLLKRLNSLC